MLLSSTHSLIEAFRPKPPKKENKARNGPKPIHRTSPKRARPLRTMAGPTLIGNHSSKTTRPTGKDKEKKDNNPRLDQFHPAISPPN
ncbi:hypothetical protein B0T21DRAFT_368400 [Apiosordaria backusii]|uniref:Uncharacterized protein n=1 Tax=Apiosordaria backusii TaxID=314023 RepID=A0AA40BK67_9PEZI|nr:hypothetical protein B0T21DRAFT_368400 [Apiosordaria backusii]